MQVWEFNEKVLQDFYRNVTENSDGTIKTSAGYKPGVNKVIYQKQQKPKLEVSAKSFEESSMVCDQLRLLLMVQFHM